MCELCSDDTIKRAEAGRDLRALASTLKKHATQLEAMAGGRIKPHTDDAKAVGITARVIVRELVKEWW